MKTIALLVASTLFYGVFHFLLVRAIRNSDLAESLLYAQRKSTFEVTPRRVALKICACIQIICAFLMGLLVVHDVTSAPKNAYEIRVQVSLLLLPVRSTASDYTLRAVVLTTGFWIFHFLSDVRRFFFWSRKVRSKSGNAGEGLLASNTKAIQFLKLVSTHICPLTASWAFIHWRSSQFFGNPEGEGMGFTDLMIGLLLCCLLPGLLDNTRWIVFAVDPDSKNSWEAVFMDIAVAINRLVCHVVIWPFLLLIYYRHEHGGIMDPSVEVPNPSAILSAFASLPLRCSIGTLAFFSAGIYALYGDMKKAKKSLLPQRKVETAFLPPNTSKTTPKRQSVNKPLMKKESWKLSLEEQGGEEAPTEIPYEKPQEEMLPESLLKLATTPEDLNWLRAQKRIARQVREEARIEKERLARGGSFNEEEDEHIELLRKKDA